MCNGKVIWALYILVLFLTVPIVDVWGADESYIQSISGKIKKGDSCIVMDDKFMNLSSDQWNAIRNISVANFISFELRTDTNLYYYNKPFTCTLKVSVKYFTTRDQTTANEINDIILVVRFDTVNGKHYPVIAKHSFKNAFKVIVVINSISSSELGEEIPAIFRLSNQILVQRKYPFTQQVTALLNLSSSGNNVKTDQSLSRINPDVTSNNTVNLTWDPSDFTNWPGGFGAPEEYDVEWTYFDNLSQRAVSLGFAPYTSITDDQLSEWMLNDNTRVTVQGNIYSINLVYGNGFIIVRVRGVAYDPDTGLRLVSNWQYRQTDNNIACLDINPHQSNLNWQYSAAFAEEGKRKEVVSYFDGSMRSRQSVTVNNTDKVAIAAETIYDNMGRPAVNILPSPVIDQATINGNSVDYDSKIKFYNSINKNSGNQTYSFSDINPLLSNGNCSITAGALNSNDGAGNYYSPQNPYLNSLNHPDFYFSKHIPDAGGYPFALTEYTPDNTGRIKRQGGVGAAFQTGNNHETQYYYGKPTQTDLDRIFGVEVGNASHYLKNMVVDPNGQISVSYVDAGGKTIATALAGKAPANLDQLPSSVSSEANTRLNQAFIKTNDFRIEANALLKQASATFLAAVTGTFKINYSIKPAALVTTPAAVAEFCSNCFYDVLVEVRNDCGDVVAIKASQPFTGNDVVCSTDDIAINDFVDVPVNKIGEYTATYTMRLSEDVINFQLGYFIEHNTDLKTLQRFFNDLMAEADLDGCYSECSTCEQKLGSRAEFTGKMNELLSTIKTEKYPDMVFNPQEAQIQTWIDATYTRLFNNCQALAAGCNPVSLCEDRLQHLQNDVRPGGQYARYDIETYTIPASEQQVSILKYSKGVLLSYKDDIQITNFEFTDDLGNIRHIKDANVTEAEFFKAYLKHPEWVDDFVKRHIEYCSYEWCVNYATPSNSFDALIRDNLSSGSDAIAKGFFDPLNHKAILDNNKDPFFITGGPGASFKQAMQADLINISDVLHITLRDATNNPLSSKNVLELINWMLYCKPANADATATDFINSWSCIPTASCRSYTSEWELYRNYYLKLKNKYVQLAKQAWMPNCINCFIGVEPVVTENCASICEAPSNVDFAINGTKIYAAGFNSNGTGTVNATLLNSFWSSNCGSGNRISNAPAKNRVQDARLSAPTVLDAQLDVTYDCERQPAPRATACGPLNRTSIWLCTNSSNEVMPLYTPVTITRQVYFPETKTYYIGLASDNLITLSLDNAEIVNITDIDNYYSWHVYPVAISRGFHTLTISAINTNGAAGFGCEIYNNSQAQLSAASSLHDLAILYSTNNEVGKPLDLCTSTKSSCGIDSRAQLYGSKLRIFNEYTDEEAELNCLVNKQPGYQTVQDVEDAIAGSIENVRQQAVLSHEDIKIGWRDRLQSVRDEEFSTLAGSTLSNTVIDNLINNLYEVSKKNIEIQADPSKMQPARTLPSGVISSNGHSSFKAVFTAIIGASLMQQGFGPELLDQPYPHDKLPMPVLMQTGELTSNNCDNLALLYTNFLATGGSTNAQFHEYLKSELQSDYVFTLANLEDVLSRCGSNCNLLNDPLTLPAVFSMPANIQPWVSCQALSDLFSSFETEYPNVNTDSKLYRVLLSNYLNFSLGYSLSLDEYLAFSLKCSTSSALLYNKSASPVPVRDDFDCVANIMTGIAEKSGQEYQQYLDLVKIAFRNQYISKCLSNQASASLEGDQYEYHYTLYYYDQSGNLIKTVPPEGVRLLNEKELADLDDFRNNIPQPCTGEGLPTTENVAETFSTMSSLLQNNTGRSIEMWIYQAGESASRQVRIITPDNKYFYQAAIANGKLWVELYTLLPGTNSIDVTLTNQAVAELPYGGQLKSWSHLVIQSESSLSGGVLELYLDGEKLVNLPATLLVPYPFEWEISASAGSYVLPLQELTVLKHLRMYSRPATDAEVMANYRNSCLNPVDALAIRTNPLALWGRFNIPDVCNSTAQVTTVSNGGSLHVGTQGGTHNYVASNVSNSFTVELWVNPLLAHEVDAESQSSIEGVSGQQYAIFPSGGGYPVSAGMGISVGTNGVSVYEHANAYMPPLLSWAGNVSGWTHVAVVYNNRTPSLYINGEFVKTGLTSVIQNIYPSYNIGEGYYGAMQGNLDEVRIWSRSLTASEIIGNYNKSVPANSIGLEGYWPLSATDGSIINDITCNNHDIPLTPLQHTWSAASGTGVLDNIIVEAVDRTLIPSASLATNYYYNSLNQVVKQTTPDGGTSEFWYDRLGRLTISQNAEQKQPAVVNAENPASRYSYTRYDALGRIYEVGEKTGGGLVTESDARDNSFLQSWLNAASNRQVTVTAYDEAPAWAPTSLLGMQQHLRNRVSATALLSAGASPADAGLSRLAASYYSYDIAGNVSRQIQENTALSAVESQYISGGTGLKELRYEYDLVSGKVNKVLYQNGKWDQFYYRYLYDADNRIVSALSSRNNYATASLWTTEATYRYYLHGPLARMELGKNKVQGIDYAYTLQGWLKGVNSLSADADKDMSGDGKQGSPFQYHARDVMGFSLGYYEGDYTAVGGANAPAFGTSYQQPVFDMSGTIRSMESGKGLFNGNISHSTYFNRPLDNVNTRGYSYRYDQLNRLTASNAHTITGSAGWGNGSIIDAYKEAITYDGNGNIKTFLRNGSNSGGNPLAMDEMTYGYTVDNNGRLVNNKLRHVKDQVPALNYSAGGAGSVADIDNQLNDNYSYDKIGNLTADNAENIQGINWTVYGKIASITKGSTFINYGYDAGGNRISKSVTGTGNTCYVRDAQGNVMGVYRTASDGYHWDEQHLYGSSRIGMVTPGFTIVTGQPLASSDYVAANDPVNNGVEGLRMYELSNHLGNVLATITDKKIGIPLQGNSSLTDYYEAEVVSAQDYYSFGMTMPGRKYTASSSSYRYGFNGMEKDDEVKGEGNQLDYKMRIYDPRLGRFLSVDPIADEYPQLTPYQFASNQPIESIDMDGLERMDYRAVKGDDGTAKLTLVSEGPKEWKGRLLGFTINTTAIPYHVRIEYNGQHYVFADGTKRTDVTNLPAGSGYGQYPDAVHYASDYNSFLANPDGFVKTHRSEETEVQEWDDALAKAELASDIVQAVADGVSSGRGGRGRLPRIRIPKPSTSSNKPAMQQKVVATPNTTVKQKAAAQQKAIVQPHTSRGYDRPEIETKSGRAVRQKDVLKRWNDFLGSNQTNIDPRDGKADPDRIWSADGKRSIRFGSHEAKGDKKGLMHYHEETWHSDKVENVYQKVQN